MTTDSHFQTAVALLKAAGYADDGLDLISLPGGRNNRVFRINTRESTFLMKSFYHHPDDRRDRLSAEFGFCRFAWNQNLAWTPRPLAMDVARRTALFEFVNGRRPDPAEVDEAAMDAALKFFLDINRFRDAEDGAGLGDASEACFSIGDQLTCVEGRVARLKDISADTPLDREAGRFARTLMEGWENVRRAAVSNADHMKIGLDDSLDGRDRCLSPSDFGFHNSLRTQEGRYRFLDFEYAGWDDPAKMICDFFSQAVFPISMLFYDKFATHAFSFFPDPEWHMRRARILYPVFQIKWCCIILNEFLPVERDRRVWATGNTANERKCLQLEKARKMFQGVGETGLKEDIFALR